MYSNYKLQKNTVLRSLDSKLNKGGSLNPHLWTILIHCAKDYFILQLQMKLWNCFISPPEPSLLSLNFTHLKWLLHCKLSSKNNSWHIELQGYLERNIELYIDIFSAATILAKALQKHLLKGFKVRSKTM